MRQCRCDVLFVYKSISREKSCSSFEKFPFLELAGNTICYNTLLSIFGSINRQVVAYGRLNTNKHFKFLALKVVAVVYEKWSLTRGSKYSDLIWKLLVFWKTGR